MKKFNIIYEEVINESLQDLRLNKFFELATRELPDITVERVTDYTPDKRLYTIKHNNQNIAYVIKKKQFIKPKFIMRPEDKKLKLKPIILPYMKGMKIKFNRITDIVNDFTIFLDKCKGQL
jgi:hypothetical protein